MTTKKEDLLISIITPYYKTLEYTKKLAKVLEPQLTNECEWIIIDDGCNELELDKLKAKVIHQENEGVSQARNKGLDNAKGKYVVFIDSDDLVKPTYIKTILDKIKEEQFDYCYFSWEATGRNKGQYIIKDEPEIFNTCVWNCVYKKETIGNNKFPKSKQIGEEIEFNKKVRIGKKANILDILYIYNSGREDSLTVNYSQGKIKEDREEIIRTQVVIYRSFLSIIGGIETSVYNACSILKDKYDIIFLYDTADIHQLRRLKQLVKCVQYSGQQIECDTLLLYGFNPASIFHTVKAKKVIQQICCNVKDVNYKYQHNEAINEFYADSEASAKQFMDSNPKYKCGVLHNLYGVIQPKKCIRIMTASRLSWEKGYDTMKTYAKRMIERNIPFIWTVFTNDKPNEEIDGFIFMKPRLNILDYMKGNDYGFQGSKSESWGGTPSEFLECGVPMICTEWSSVREQIEDGINGYILKQDLSNMDEVIDKMYNNDLKGFKYTPKYSIKEWTDIIGDLGGKKDNYEEEKDMKYLVEALNVYKVKGISDSDLGRIPNEGEQFEVSAERLEVLLGSNPHKLVFVKLVEESKKGQIANEIVIDKESSKEDKPKATTKKKTTTKKKVVKK